MSPEEIVDFYHSVLKHSDLTTNWRAVAKDAYNVQNANKSQKDYV